MRLFSLLSKYSLSLKNKQDEKVNYLYAKKSTGTNEFAIPKYSKWTDFPIFIPEIEVGYVIRCYDGDTVTIISNPYGNMCRFTIRVLGVDTPELRMSSSLERSAAEIVRDELNHMIINRFVRIKIHSIDKYGRLLADIWVIRDSNELHINKWLLDMRYAIFYDGGKKSEFDDEFLMGIIRHQFSKKDANDNNIPVLDNSDNSDNSL